MSFNVLKKVAVAMLVLGLAGVSATAQPTEMEPGSVLLYPQVDSRLGIGMGTVISVTNTLGDRRVRQNNLRVGDVQIQYFYVEGRNNWQVSDRIERLTPNDMFTVLAGDHNPQTELGFLLIVAQDPEVEVPISFNYLIGDEILVDVQGNRTWSLTAIPFKCLLPFEEGLNTVRTTTDVNQNGAVDFDNVEYDYWPDALYMNRFFQQNGALETELILVSMLGRDFRISVGFLFYDNEEDVFSRSFDFICWTSVKLSDISLITRNLGGRSGELPTGWARINGDRAFNLVTGEQWTSEEGQPNPLNQDPPLLGAYVERILPAAGYEYGHLLHHSGAQNGNEFPPDNVN
jgi:hypothetical protein